MNKTFKIFGKTLSATTVLIFLMSIIGQNSFGQISYRVGLDADKVTYRVFMKSVASYSNIQAKISTAQVTLIVPHGIGASQFLVSNLQGKSVGSNQMNWGVSRVDAPNENKAADYISFGYNGSGSPLLFNIVAGEEIELFNFKNTGTCTGSVALITNTDPFSPPNSANTNPGNQMTVLGFGTGNAYQSNYGGSVTCLTSTTVADITAAITGSNVVTSNTATNYTINVSNIGTAASNGTITVSTTLPAGVVYNSTSGSGWSSSTSPQTGGATLVSSTYNQSIATGASATPLLINVTPSNALNIGSSFTLNGVVAGGGETNLTNNSFNKTSTIQANTTSTDLGVSVGVNSTTSTIGGNVIFTYTAQNFGSISASNIQNQISLPAGFTISNINVPAGTTFNQTTKIWTINTLTASQNIQLVITGSPTTEGVSHTFINFITSSVTETNTSNNLATACYSIPVKLCAGTNYIARIDKKFTNIQWYKNASIISGAITDTLVINSAGTYTFTSSVTTISCPLVVTANTNTSTLVINPTSVNTCGNYNLTSLKVTLNGNTITNSLSYYKTQADALAGTNQLGSFVTQSGKYWIRYKPSNDCPYIGSVDVILSSSLSFTQPSPTCAANFDLASVELFNNGVKVTSGITYYGTFSNFASSVVIYPLSGTIVSNSGLYYATVKNSNGCISLASIQVKLTGPRTPSVTDVSNQCPATTVNLLSLNPYPSTVGGVFEWHISNSATSALVNTPSAAGAGTYYIFEKSTNGCISNGDAVKVVIQSCCSTPDCAPFRMLKTSSIK
ncbi:hypothetical protein GCM10011514_52840 [Emticicia aquatilis]|uniref:DUF11 domain-containing protein n=1 Tax=Emticicia aquatilis TaxID=1537369 RepID=A0A916ZA51_9BACT|nr:DUF11 domain-containing protein [Emticicia aquatilis]GGD82249.1 hypothetical protein GCM10011514_52840 [Emticicia aquatilis]